MTKLFFLLLPGLLAAQTIAIRAGRLIDPDLGSVATDQIILVEDGHILTIGPNLQVAVPAKAEVIDLSQYSVLPGLVDAHNHLALTYKREPESNSYYLTSVLDSTAIRAIQAVSNGITMLNAGFTVVRDLGNNANYADSALRVGIEAGLDSGPDDHQLRHYHRRTRGSVLPCAGALWPGLSRVPRCRHAR